ncbi:MAG: cation efflux protein [Chlorobi bacterium]|nr:cation efflux protein [Chlorobiota bacterium]
MGHDHNHSHGHGHSHGPATYNRAFAIGVGLNLAFVGVEAFYGIMAHSVALVADAGHNLSDVLGLLLAWGASYLARRLPTERHTYGLRRSSILAALLNAVLLLVAVGGIAWESLRRLGDPGPVSGGIVMWVAALGIVVNGVTALLFAKGRKGDINIRGAFLHMAADAAVSLGVVIAGFAINATGLTWIDPVVSLVIITVITAGTWGLLRESFNLAMDAVPESIDRRKVEEYLTGIDGVIEVHDLHIWGMSTTEPALTVHLVKPDGNHPDEFIACICDELHQRFGIEHATIQIERGDGSRLCEQAPHNVV